jgi:hypothetical protein
MLVAIVDLFHETCEAAKTVSETFVTIVETTVITDHTKTIAATIAAIARKMVNQVFPGIKLLSVFLWRILWNLRVTPAIIIILAMSMRLAAITITTSLLRDPNHLLALPTKILEEAVMNLTNRISNIVVETLPIEIEKETETETERVVMIDSRRRLRPMAKMLAITVAAVIETLITKK